MHQPSQPDNGQTPTPAPVPPKELDQRAKRQDRRNSVVDRRVGLDRREPSSTDAAYTGTERRSSTERRETSGLERRRGPGRRRRDGRKAPGEGESTAGRFRFLM